jgi:hypothetical protein
LGFDFDKELLAKVPIMTHNVDVRARG